jgi:hypothetical protein
MNEIYRYYKCLDLEPEASLEEVKKAYRDLVKVWHPDRFPDSQRLQKKANEKLSKINEAYEKITLHISHKEQIIREKPEEPIYEEQSRRDDQDRKTSEDFPKVDLVSLLGKPQDSIEVKHFILSLKERPENVSYYYPFLILNDEPVDSSRSFYYKFQNNAIDIVIINNLLRAIFLYSIGLKGYIPRQYKGSIPHDLKFSDDRQTTIKKLGSPLKSVRGGYFGDKGVWEDKWVFPKYLIWVKYDSDGRMRQISLNEVRPVKEKGKWWQELWKGLNEDWKPKE